MKKIRLIAVIVATALTLGACSGMWTTYGGGSGSGDASASSQSGSSPTGASGTAFDPALEQFYTQDLSWSSCETDYECATISVPMDYENPDGESIEVALMKLPASGLAIGSLLINPGGPGASGQDFVQSATSTFGDRILESYDLIGFDPRGVGDSTPVVCYEADEMIALMERSYPDTDEGEAQAKADTDAYISACVENTGESIKYVGTKESAQDMDVIRELVGDAKLNYVGFSYGTSLGGMYAELFPQTVGRMVLDGAVDSSVSNFDQTLQQLKGFELATNNYLDYCLGLEDCPFTGTRDEARQEIIDLFEKTATEPIPTSNPDRPLTQTALVYGYITPLYDDSMWMFLDMGFQQVFEDNDGSLFQFLFDAYMGIDPSTGELLNNQIAANGAINCADTEVQGDEATWEKQSEQLAEEAPILGPVMGYSEYSCTQYPKADTEKVNEYVAKGSDPIVVIGTTGDPATPYEWSQAFEEKLDNGVLLTYEGEGHTAYGRSGPCIGDAVDNYLVDGTVPEDGLVCGAN